MLRCALGKLAGQDKKNFGLIDETVVEELSSSPSLYSTSPVGPLTDSHSRKTLIYLILTLNHAYPDHDFSNLRPNNFSKEEDVVECKEKIDSRLFEVGKIYDYARLLTGEEGGAFGGTSCGNGLPFADELWRYVDAAINLKDVNVYSYDAVNAGDPFDGDGSLWNFIYFFYNRKLKRILFFSCAAKIKRNHASEEDLDDGGPMIRSQNPRTSRAATSVPYILNDDDDWAMDDMQ